MLRVVLDGSPLRDGRRDAGIGRYVTELSRALSERNDVDARLAVPPLNAPESWVRRYVLAQPWILAEAVRRRARIVHGLASDPVLGWPLGRQVVTVHDVAPWTTHAPAVATPTWRYLQMQRTRLCRCAAVVAVSPSTAADVEDVLGVSKDRIHVVPEGVGAAFGPDPQPDDERRRRDARAPERYVLWVGNMRAHDARKGLDDLIDSVSALDVDAPTIVLAGRAGVEAERIARNAEERGVNVVITGFVEDATLAALYRGAAVVAIPSTHEGFGLPLLESMACGAPVVASRAGNHPWLAGDDAMLIEAGDVRELASAMRAALTDPSLRERARSAGPKRAAPFTWQRAAQLTADIYHAVAAV
jgi:glycosyltransferase involved in cell wall biosynthesis